MNILSRAIIARREGRLGAAIKRRLMPPRPQSIAPIPSVVPLPPQQPPERQGQRTYSLYGAEIEIPAGDRMFWTIEQGYGYEPHSVPHVLACLHADDTFVDVGANIGIFACAAGKIAQRVIAIEPDPKNVDYLRRNLARNRIQNTAVFPVAASNTATVEYLSDLGGSNQYILDAPTHSATRAIAAMPLDVLLARENPGVMKIDVEGREPKVIEGSMATIMRCLPDIMLEYSPIYVQNACGHEGRAMLATLFDLGYIALVQHFGNRTALARTPDEVLANWRESKEMKFNHIDILWRHTVDKNTDGLDLASKRRRSEFAG